MKNILTYKLFESEDQIVKAIHITTLKAAEIIKDSGFDPVAFLKWNYYSALGHGGIYFYPETTFGWRFAQRYAYAVASKSKEGIVAIIHVELPWSIVKSNQGNPKLTDEDGWFVETGDLKKVEILDVDAKRPGDMY